jgi:nicotinamide-nucleotide amidase
VQDVVAELLLSSHTTIAIAESLTAGRASDLLASVPGISRCLLAGVASYSNDAKVEFLGVPQHVLDDHGAVSEACAMAMADGVRKRTGATIGISSTGVAGPGGGSLEKPVGTVYIALSDERRTQALRLHLLGDREQIRDRATTALLNLARLYLLKTTGAKREV